jgi:hypothetical protein
MAKLSAQRAQTGWPARWARRVTSPSPWQWPVQEVAVQTAVLYEGNGASAWSVWAWAQVPILPPRWAREAVAQVVQAATPSPAGLRVVAGSLSSPRWWSVTPWVPFGEPGGPGVAQPPAPHGRQRRGLAAVPRRIAAGAPSAGLRSIGGYRAFGAAHAAASARVRPLSFLLTRINPAIKYPLALFGRE